ncbi:MAG: response regulator, partial [Thermodesulfovibrionales bacterium]|nr:response regulator [Thermodesulfovibrionales bacterium]
MNNTVLLIENDQDTVSKAAGALEGAGYTIVSADTAQEGTDKAKELIPVLILINLATPGANGLELCKSLHNTEGLTEVPIVLLTLREGKFEPVYTKLYGIVSFLKKPFNDDELLALAQEHSPVAEAEEPIGDDSTMEMGADSGDEGFGAMEMDSGMDEGDEEGVFSIDETEQSLDDLQSSFQEPLEEDTDMSADTSGEMDDEFEGTQQFSLDDTEGMDSDGAADEDAGG